MNTQWEGKTALVTGAGTGIGAATAILLAERGASVALVGRSTATLESVRERIREIAADESRVKLLAGDVANPTDRARMVELVNESWGRLDLLVNNAAAFLFGGIEATPEQWQRTLDVNLLAPAHLTVAFLGLLAKNRGAVVHVSSISAHIAQAGRWTYNSAKAGLIELTRAQALDLAPHGVRVNSVSPGWIWTEALDQAADGDRDRWEKVWGAYCPQNRCGEPEEVAEAISFLGSSAASFITGADLAVDGGYLAIGPEGAGVFELER